MSTRSHIGKVYPDGTVQAVYHHSDGYLEGLGQQLVDWLGGQTLERRQFIIDKLMAEQVGWSCVLGSNIDLPPSWDKWDHNADYNEFYGNRGPQSYTARDGADDVPRRSYATPSEYVRQMQGDIFIEWAYIFSADYGSMDVYELEFSNEKLMWIGKVDFTDERLSDENSVAGHRHDIRLLLGVPLSEDEE